MNIDYYKEYEEYLKSIDSEEIPMSYEEFLFQFIDKRVNELSEEIDYIDIDYIDDLAIPYLEDKYDL